MRSHQILILSNQPLFAQAVRNLVEANGGLKVLGIEAHDDKIMDRVKELCPDIIILGDEKDLPSTVLPTLLNALPGVRIIRLTLDGNVIRVYDCHQMVAHCAKDLVDAFDALLDQSVSPTVAPPSAPDAPAGPTEIASPIPIANAETPTTGLAQVQSKSADPSDTADARILVTPPTAETVPSLERDESAAEGKEGMAEREEVKLRVHDSTSTQMRKGEL